jgi:hypothetical protein
MDPRWQTYFEGQRRAAESIPDASARQQFLSELADQERRASAGQLRFPSETPEERAQAQARSAQTLGQQGGSIQAVPPIPVQSVIPPRAPPPPLPQTPGVQTTSASAWVQTILRPLNADFNILDNELNNYDRYAYHLKLSMIGDFDSNDPNIAANIRRSTGVSGQNYSSVIVAESGVTAGFNIIDCEIRDALSSSFRTRTSITTEINFTIVEPYSLTLADKLYLAAEELKVKNWRLAPMILEVWFNGYTEEGTPFDTKSNESIYKIYKLIITDFTSTLTETGTTYKLTAVADGNVGFRNAFFMLPVGFNYDSSRQFAPTPVEQGRLGVPQTPFLRQGPGTVADFFRQLQDNLNEFYRNARVPAQARQIGQVSNELPLLIYRFFITYPALASQDINFTPTSFSRRTSFSATTGGVIGVSRNTSISNIIDDIMSSLKDPNFFAVNETDGRIRVPTVECRVANVGWDALLNDYVREITYFIGIRETYRPIPDPDFGRLFQNIPENARARLLAQSKFVRKAYPYYYTGNNTEILSLNVEFNNLHVLPIPFGGTSLVPPAILGQVQQSSLASLRRQVTEARSRLTEAEREVQQRRAQLPSAGEAGGRSLPEAERRLGEAQRQFDERASALQRLQQQGIGELVRGSIPPGLIDQATQAAIEASRQQLITPRFRGFAEDLRTRTLAPTPGQLTYFADAQDIVNTWTRAVAGNINEPSRIAYASITAQIYDRIGDSMTEIDLEIKGDPYWMGQTNLEREIDLNRVSRPGTPGAASVTGLEPEAPRSGVLDRFNRDSMFMLLFRAGVAPNESTGYMDLKNNVEWFHALYLGIEVTHIFRDGKFTQKIHAIREPINNLLAQGALPVTSEQQAPVEEPPQTGIAGRPPNERFGIEAPPVSVPTGSELRRRALERSASLQQGGFQ